MLKATLLKTYNNNILIRFSEGEQFVTGDDIFNYNAHFYTENVSEKMYENLNKSPLKNPCSDISCYWYGYYSYIK